MHAINYSIIALHHTLHDTLFVTAAYVFSDPKASWYSCSMTFTCVGDRGWIEQGNGSGLELKPSENANLESVVRIRGKHRRKRTLTCQLRYLSHSHPLQVLR